LFKARGTISRLLAGAWSISYECPYRAAALLLLVSHLITPSTWKSILHNDAAPWRTKNKWMEINMKILNWLFSIPDKLLATQ